MNKDVLHTLTDDHSVLVRLAERVEAAPEGRARKLLFNEFARALGAHETVVDRTVMPALKACGWSGVSSDVLTHHMALKRLLAEALTAERAALRFDEAARRLAQEIKAQCELERRKLFPVLQRCFDDGQRSLMALEAEQHFTRLLGETPQVHEDAELAGAAGDLVEEAYVVLGSLPDASLWKLPRR